LKKIECQPPHPVNEAPAERPIQPSWRQEQSVGLQINNVIIILLQPSTNKTQTNPLNYLKLKSSGYPNNKQTHGFWQPVPGQISGWLKVLRAAAG